MSRRAGVDVFPIDIGVQTKTKVYEDKVAWGTRNMAKGPAMSKEEAQEAIHAASAQPGAAGNWGIRSF